MSIQTEADVLQYIETVIQNYINTCITTVAGWSQPVDENTLTDEDKVIYYLSRCRVLTDPDIEWELVDINGNPTPVILLELDGEVPTQSSVQGTIVNSEQNFSLSVFINRENRDFYTYKKEKCLIKYGLLNNIFAVQTQRRLLIRDSAFDDFALGEIKAGGFALSITTNLNNYDYTVT